MERGTSARPPSKCNRQGHHASCSSSTLILTITPRTLDICGQLPEARLLPIYSGTRVRVNTCKPLLQPPPWFGQADIAAGRGAQITQLCSLQDQGPETASAVREGLHGDILERALNARPEPKIEFDLILTQDEPALRRTSTTERLNFVKKFFPEVFRTLRESQPTAHIHYQGDIQNRSRDQWLPGFRYNTPWEDLRYQEETASVSSIGSSSLSDETLDLIDHLVQVSKHHGTGQ